MNHLRAKTADEVQKELLDSIRSIVAYWSEVPNKTSRERCDGVAFSILSLIDGEYELPAMDIRLAPHPEDKEFYQSQGENWYEDGMLINDCALHERWHSHD